MSERREQPAVDRAAAAAAIDEFLRAIGLRAEHDPELVGTGARVTAAFVEQLCAGVGVDRVALLREHVLAAPAGAGWVTLRDLPVLTICPHHLMPAEGSADVAYAPRAHIVGLGAITKLVECSAKRLVLQENLGADIAQALDEALSPRWACVRLRLRHACMRVSGEQPGSSWVETYATIGELPTFAGALFAEGRS